MIGVWVSTYTVIPKIIQTPDIIFDQIKSNHFLLSHHHSTSALVSEILMSVLQTVQKKQQTIYIWTDSAKKTTNNLHMDRQCKKNCTGAFTVLQTVQKKKTTTIYIWTVHIYRLYRRQCAKYTYIYSVHIVYYKDTLNYQRHCSTSGCRTLQFICVSEDSKIK